MPLTCIVVSCGSRADRDKVSFFAVPTAMQFQHAIHLNDLSGKRRQQWLHAIKRKDLTESKIKYEKVCSKHFVTGKPASLQDVNHPDWVPTQNMGYNVGHASKRKSDVDRKERLDSRKRRKMPVEVVQVCEELVDSSIEQSGSGIFTQTDLTGIDLENQIDQLKFANGKMEELSKALNRSMLTFDALKNDHTKCHYYTGFDFPVLEIIFSEVQEFIPVSTVNALEPFQQFVVTLMKLRLNLPFKDIAYRFGISQTTCSSYFNLVVDCMYKRFRTLIIWPEREVIKKNMPSCFKEAFHDNTTVIIDCFEIFIQKPANYLTQQQSWSNYKHHNTIKFLIGITPQGTISFISDAWGGRTSDKQIVEHCGFLNKLNPNDVVLADRGFLISDSLAILGAKLVIPAFTKGKKQLFPLEIETTRKIANVRIHVERIIGTIKSKFMIFKGPIPISMLTNTVDNVNILDKIVVVCCALVNISPPIVPL